MLNRVGEPLCFSVESWAQSPPHPCRKKALGNLRLTRLLSMKRSVQKAAASHSGSVPGPLLIPPVCAHVHYRDELGFRFLRAELRNERLRRSAGGPRRRTAALLTRVWEEEVE
ncbi:hypothetical protein SKAU_G00126340 [Synaphobranchus kaupii]|uniref:Uncharacterized protein n=1 Tax=Synaphobranchus kaupii TaxID=118154 RepID=A0A9Q1FQE4_SYNKA|nr:hypothetical protein SKAU_G00126340 [Synaphobranchus kaupii]